MSVSNAQGVSASQSAAGLGPVANGLQALFGEAVAAMAGRSSTEAGDQGAANGANLFRQQLESALLARESESDGQVLPLDPNFSSAMMATFAAMDEAILLKDAEKLTEGEVFAKAERALAQAERALIDVQQKLQAMQAAALNDQADGAIDQAVSLQQGLAQAQQVLAQAQEKLALMQAAKVTNQSNAAEAAALLKTDVANQADEALQTIQQQVVQQQVIQQTAQQPLSQTQQALNLQQPLAQAQQALAEVQQIVQQKLAVMQAAKVTDQSDSEQVAQAIQVDNSAESHEATAMKQALSLQQPLAQAQAALADVQLKLQALQNAHQSQQPTAKAQETLDVIRNAQALPQVAAAAVEEFAAADMANDSKSADPLSQQAVTDRANSASLGIASAASADKTIQETGANRTVQESRSGAQLEAARASLGSGPLNVEVLRLSRQGGGRAVIEVTPPNQGPIRLDLQLDGSGRATLVVEGLTDAMRARLEGTAHFLRQDMASLGLALNLEMRERSEGNQAQGFGFGQSMEQGQNSSSSKSFSLAGQSIEEGAAKAVVSGQSPMDSGEINLYA
jgi:hypothetical protein